MTLLSHLKVLDFSTLLPGPFATLLLADLGAEVLHVQKPSIEEPLTPTEYLNRSKKSIALNLKEKESIDAIKKLVREYDIVLEQFRPGVMERLGLGYEELKKENPSLIYCSLTGYGQTGPYKDRAGHDINYLSIAGVASYSGTKEGGPANQATQIADIAGGSLHSVIAILSAVIYRERTGRGQYIDISMTDCSFTLNALFASEYLVKGKMLESEDLLLNGGSFYGYYQTKDGRYFSVGSLEPQFRSALCKAIGREDLIEISMNNKPEHIAYFKEALSKAFLTKDFKEWQDIFLQYQACAEPVLTFAESCVHPQLVDRGMIVEVPTPSEGLQKQIGCPIKTSVFTLEYKHSGVNPGKSIQDEENNK